MRRVNRETGLVGVHCLGATLEDHAGDVRDDDVLALQPKTDQQVQAGQGRGAGTGGDEAHVADGLADHAQPVQDRGGNDDRRAMLIVVEDRDAHAAPQRLFDDEAVRGLDVLKIDAAEARLQRRDDLHQALRVALVDLDVEDIDVGELLEQHRLAFHDRLRGQAADGTQTEHGGAVGDHRHQVAAGRVMGGIDRIGDDLFTGGRDTW